MFRKKKSIWKFLCGKKFGEDDGFFLEWKILWIISGVEDLSCDS